MLQFKQLFSILKYIIRVIYSCDAMNFSSHYSKLQSRMVL